MGEASAARGWPGTAPLRRMNLNGLDEFVHRAAPLARARVQGVSSRCTPTSSPSAASASSDRQAAGGDQLGLERSVADARLWIGTPSPSLSISAAIVASAIDAHGGDPQAGDDRRAAPAAARRATSVWRRLMPIPSRGVEHLGGHRAQAREGVAKQDQQRVGDERDLGGRDVRASPGRRRAARTARARGSCRGTRSRQIIGRSSAR